MQPESTAAEYPLDHSESRTRGIFRAGKAARMTYLRPEPDVMNVDHTIVDPAHRGKGLAQLLFREMTAFARANGRKVVATCPFVKSMFERHPEDAGLLAEAKKVAK